MYKHFNLTCPTKDKEVTVIIDYINASSMVDFTPCYIKGRMISCNQRQCCDSCDLYKQLPERL